MSYVNANDETDSIYNIVAKICIFELRVTKFQDFWNHCPNMFVLMFDVIYLV